jgi:hypothetical protein
MSSIEISRTISFFVFLYLLSMHPNLALHKHPLCKEVIEALNRCHSEHYIAKFWGACNREKADLDVCLGLEVI